MNVMNSSSILCKSENTKPLYSPLSLVGYVESQGNRKLCFLHGKPRGEFVSGRGLSPRETMNKDRKTELKRLL